MAAILYKKGLIICELYEKMCGDCFSDFIARNFKSMFERAGKQTRRWLQDDDPSQNSAKSKRAMKSVNSDLLLIPARSPNLNPIENMFIEVRVKLRDEAIEKDITKESYDQFKIRVANTINSIPIDYIARVIEGTDNRTDKVIQRKDERLKC